MPLTFTAAERLAITRRQVRIALENDGFNTSINAFNDQQAQLLQVDNSNKNFYDFYDKICRSYELEAQHMTGQIPDTYTNADIAQAAMTPSVPPFFPMTPSAYTKNIPLISDGPLVNNKVKGFFHPIGIDTIYENKVLSDINYPFGLTEIIYFLNNGITGSATVTTTTNIPAGPVTGLVLNTGSSPLTGFSVGNKVYISGGSASGIYEITAITLPVITPIPAPGSLTVKSILPTLIGISSGSITNNAPAFTATQRENLTGGIYQEILNNITNRISTLMSEWNTIITQILTDLNNNEEDRPAFITQKTAAITDANNVKSAIAAWNALPNTGSGAKFTVTVINNISTLITNRQSFIATRMGQIGSAFGGSSANALTQTGDTYSSTDPSNPYYKRYKWLNFRINRMSGSLRRYYSASQSKDAIQNLLNDNNAIKSEYDSYFLTKAIIFNDGSDIVHVKDVIGLSVGDTITVVSETQPEITRTILQIMGTTQLKLNAPVPKTYKLADVARVFKTL